MFTAILPIAPLASTHPILVVLTQSWLHKTRMACFT